MEGVDGYISSMEIMEREPPALEREVVDLCNCGGLIVEAEAPDATLLES